MLLSAIRIDLARPTVHARNLFHSSALMYDLWAVYDNTADTYFLGRSRDAWSCPFSDEQRAAFRSSSTNVASDRRAAISHGMFRLLNHRFQQSPGKNQSLLNFELTFTGLGYDTAFTSTDISGNDPAALGNYLAECVKNYGLQDGANEAANYANQNYQPVNEPLPPDESGTPGMNNPNRWQPLDIDNPVDQSGNAGAGGPQPFLGAEWGTVLPFALTDEVCEDYMRDGFPWRVCHDSGEPALLTGQDTSPEGYRWHHELVVLWSSHLDPADGVMWDISPGSIGNTASLPTTLAGYMSFYNELEGGTTDSGHATNPVTGEPYASNMVPRGDYTRVLAEFWADGPDSETPPGHWFAVANEAVNDHAALVRRYRGEGAVLDSLQWDVKLYFVLGGAVHDAAVTAWGIKGWYDYVRPISAIRYMASLGQSTVPGSPNFHEHGLQLYEGLVELVEEGDPLAGNEGENVGKIKVKTWRGPDYVDDPDTDIAGVGWILADDWWPYQRPSFVTPPFAGYISGHSTFSRAAAEVLTSFTGDAFFPGGLGEFVAKQNEFLVFEEGPSVDVVLQWATYRDASDQTSLSRIWGGIHPPIDDIPGRQNGIAIAEDAVALADRYFNGTAH